MLLGCWAVWGFRAGLVWLRMAVAGHSRPVEVISRVPGNGVPNAPPRPPAGQTFQSHSASMSPFPPSKRGCLCLWGWGRVSVVCPLRLVSAGLGGQRVITRREERAQSWVWWSRQVSGVRASREHQACGWGAERGGRPRRSTQPLRGQRPQRPPVSCPPPRWASARALKLHTRVWAGWGCPADSCLLIPISSLFLKKHLFVLYQSTAGHHHCGRAPRAARPHVDTRLFSPRLPGSRPPLLYRRQRLSLESSGARRGDLPR